MIDIKQVLELHQLWLSDSPGGERANLSEANLSWANLRGANLSGANLSGATGIILLPVQDPRGYSWPHAIQTDDGWRIRAGCRFFTIGEAREHWGPRYTGDRELGDMYLYACDWLERKLEKLENDHD